MITARNTIASSTIESINGIVYLGKFASKDDLSWRKLKRECEDLRNVDASRGWAALAALHSVVGDVDEMERCFNISAKLCDDQLLLQHRIASSLNLGFFSTALKLFSSAGGPENGHAVDICSAGCDMGAFQAASIYIDAAIKLKVDMTIIPVEIAKNAAQILGRANVSDAHVARHLDAVGNVLRKNRIFYDGSPVILTTDVPGEFSGVTMAFKLACSQEEAFGYNIALAEQEELMGIEKNLAFDALFLPL